MSLQFHERFQRESLARAFSLLAQLGLLTQENQAFVAEDVDPCGLVRAMIFFVEDGVLSPASQAILRAHANPSALADVLYLLEQNFMLTDGHRQMVVRHPNAAVLVKELDLLHQKSMLNIENFQLVIRHSEPEGLGFILWHMHHADILNTENRIMLFHYRNPIRLRRGILNLSTIRILTKTNFDLLLAHENPNGLSILFSCMHELGVLIPECQAVVMRHDKPIELAKFCWELRHEGVVFNPDNFIHLMLHPNSAELIASIRMLQQEGIATQVLFDYTVHAFRPKRFTKLVKILTEAKLASLENLQRIVSRPDQSELFCILTYFHALGTLNQEIFTMVVSHEDISHTVLALEILLKADVLTPQSSLFLLQHHSPKLLLNLLKGLQEETLDKNMVELLLYMDAHGLLTEENLSLLVSHSKTPVLMDTFSTLLSKGLFTQANFIAVVGHPTPELLDEGVHEFLANDNLLNQEFFSMVCTHARPDLLAEAIIHLKRLKMLTSENLAMIRAHEVPNALVDKFELVNAAGLLTTINQARLFEHGVKGGTNVCLQYLQRTHLLNEENFTALLAPAHQALLFSEADDLVWARIPEAFFNQGVFQRLLIASEHIRPLEELRRVVHLILELNLDPGIIHDGQSTHTISVHRSVSASAKKLKTLYQDHLVLRDTMKAIQDDILSLESSEKHDAAKRGISRLLRSQFIDSSGVSLCQLLALAYMAIHDESQRLGSLADAKRLFIEGLYEIQRGYNLNASGVDNGTADLPICWAGSFNKIVEKLNGVHPAVEVNVITRQMASAKFPKLAALQALHHLQSLASPTTLTQAREIKILLHTLEQHQSLEPIWGSIQTQVKDLLWDEFQQAYSGTQGPVDFGHMMDSGIYIPIPDLSKTWKQLRQSFGYRQYVDAQKLHLTTHCFGLFASLDDSHTAETHRRTEESQKRLKMG